MLREFSVDDPAESRGEMRTMSLANSRFNIYVK